MGLDAIASFHPGSGVWFPCLSLIVLEQCGLLGCVYLFTMGVFQGGTPVMEPGQ